MLDVLNAAVLVSVWLLAGSAAVMGNALLYLHLRDRLRRARAEQRYVPIRSMADVDAVNQALANGEPMPDHRYDEPPEA